MINIIAFDNGVGLTKDALLLSSLLNSAGYATKTVCPKNPVHPVPRADLNIFLEILNPSLLGRSNVNAILPNPEWWPHRWTTYLPKLHVLTKTGDATRIFSRLRPRGLTEVGFISQDRFLPEITRERTFLHVAGKSSLKGTHAILDAWKSRPDWPMLTVVQSPEKAMSFDPPTNVNYIASYLSDAELKELQNRNLFHLCPSEYEGFGHYIVEALSCGAIVLTTDAEPMRELVPDSAGYLITPSHHRTMALATLGVVDSAGVASVVDRVLEASPDEVHTRRLESRLAYTHMQDMFYYRFTDWVRRILG